MRIHRNLRPQFTIEPRTAELSFSRLFGHDSFRIALKVTYQTCEGTSVSSICLQNANLPQSAKLGRWRRTRQNSNHNPHMSEPVVPLVRPNAVEVLPTLSIHDDLHRYCCRLMVRPASRLWNSPTKHSSTNSSNHSSTHSKNDTTGFRVQTTIETLNTSMRTGPGRRESWHDCTTTSSMVAESTQHNQL